VLARRSGHRGAGAARPVPIRHSATPAHQPGLHTGPSSRISRSRSRRAPAADRRAVGVPTHSRGGTAPPDRPRAHRALRLAV